MSVILCNAEPEYYEYILKGLGAIAFHNLFQKQKPSPGTSAVTLQSPRVTRRRTMGEGSKHNWQQSLR